MDFLSSILLGLIQGLTEFIPVSSSGHLIIVRHIFNIHGSSDLSVDAVLQFATVLALLVYFWKDIWKLVVIFLRWVFRRQVRQEDKNLLLAVILGTIPAVIIGLLLEKTMESLFRNVNLVAVVLIVGSIIFWFAENYAAKRKANGGTITPGKGIGIGLFQSLALVPGLSRSGITISGGLFLGLSREDAVRFSFLLSFPIIFGSGLKKLYELGQAELLSGLGLNLFLGSLVAFVVGYLSIHFLIKYLKNHTLNVFIVYRIFLAIAIFIFL